MGLAPGTRIGHYDVTALLGEGDMGQRLMPRQNRLLGLRVAAMLAVAGTAGAQGTPLSFREMVTAADTVVVAETVESGSDLVAGPSSRALVTRVTLRVYETLKGTASVLLPLKLSASVVGLAPPEVSRLPRGMVGERAVVFLSNERIVGEAQGYFPITMAPDGTEYVTLHDRRAFSAVNQIGSPITVSAVPVPTMSFTAFRADLERLLGRIGASRASPIRPPVDTSPTADQAVGLPDVHTLDIPFPARDQTFGFFQALEDEYRDTLGRKQANQGFVDAEGSAVWFPEWLRYVLNLCTPDEAANRVLMQIRGQGIQPVCGDAPAGVINFPPRDQSLAFLSILDNFYRDELDRNVVLSYIDLEGKAVWLQEYLRYRVNGCTDAEATDRVFQQIRGGGIASVCIPLSFFFEGTVGENCFVCGPGSDEFGSGVPPGTRLAGSFTFIPTTPPTPTFSPEAVDYFGVTVEVTVGSETVRGNNSALGKIRIHDGPPQGDSYSVVIEGGFSSGTIAGRRIAKFSWVTHDGSTLFSDLSLPLDPSFFTARNSSRVCIGDCFDGEILEGAIRELRLTP